MESLAKLYSRQIFGYFCAFILYLLYSNLTFQCRSLTNHSNYALIKDYCDLALPKHKHTSQKAFVCHYPGFQKRCTDSQIPNSHLFLYFIHL